MWSCTQELFFSVPKYRRGIGEVSVDNSKGSMTLKEEKYASPGEEI